MTEMQILLRIYMFQISPLNSISVTAKEVEAVLSPLHTGKSSGPAAMINNRIIKNSLQQSDFTFLPYQGTNSSTMEHANVTLVPKLRCTFKNHECNSHV